ncbi:MAG: Rne/Rng family ribonuclease [Gammaproteobacteria bacterium]|nr:Rne/Rng family ribonuclease [Gammaproteobacteria bacterium]
MEKMIINATQPEEIRVALIKDNRLYDLDVECPAEAKKKGNIYKAIVTRREPSLDAIFVEYGSKRQGFLPLKEISPEYFNKTPKNDEKLPVTALIREGQELLIQVDKEERGTKGAALTTFITLAGSYLVLMPNSPRSGGISRRIEGEERDELKETLQSLTIDENMGVIIRTAGVGKSQVELQADLDMLCTQWHAIRKAQSAELAPCLIHQEGDVITRAIRDNLRQSINEIIIDDSAAYVKAKQYISQVKPEFLPHLKLYNNPTPLFSLYQIEGQIETAHQRQVVLPSGGALVIDRTEALVSIDINSAKATSGADIESTAFNTNLEAADEISRQLRLRDLGGLVVIDFIDMSSTKHQRDVENRLKEALKADRARIQVGRISRFGLLEMSRQRLRLSLGENAQETCPRCEGRGDVRSMQSHGLAIIRLLEEEALRENVAEIQVQVPVEMATYLMNEKRLAIAALEKRHQVHVVIVANPYMQSPQYQITRIKEDSNGGRNKKPSYALAEPPMIEPTRNKTFAPPDEPVVKAYSGQSALRPHEVSVLKRLWRSVFGAAETPASTSHSSSSKKQHHTQTRRHPSSSQKRQSSNTNRKRSTSSSNASTRKQSSQQNRQSGNNASHKKPRSNSNPRTPRQKKQAENQTSD